MESDAAGSRAEEAIAAVSMTPEEQQDAVRLRAEFGEPRLRLICAPQLGNEKRPEPLWGEYIYPACHTTEAAALLQRRGQITSS